MLTSSDGPINPVLGAKGTLTDETKSPSFGGFHQRRLQGRAMRRLCRITDTLPAESKESETI